MLNLNRVVSGTLLGLTIPEEYRPNFKINSFVKLVSGEQHMASSIFIDTDAVITGSYIKTYASVSSDLSTQSSGYYYGSVCWII